MGRLLNIIFNFSHDHIELLVNSAGDQLFFRHREGQWMPTLKLYHKFPVFLPKQQVDKGAIRFVLSGANIMCPGMIDHLLSNPVITFQYHLRFNISWCKYDPCRKRNGCCNNGRGKGKLLSNWINNFINRRHVRIHVLTFKYINILHDISNPSRFSQTSINLFSKYFLISLS